MVTRRTRLLSAVSAVLMLVSMFTCFVLPAVAEPAAEYVMPTAPANLVAYSERGTSTATDFAISSAKDWLAVAKAAEDDNETFAGITLWFTNDIDFSQETLSTTVPEKTLLNNYGRSGYRFSGTIQGQGFAIKNLNYDLNWTETNGNRAYIGLICSGENAVVRDLTIDSSCSFDYTTATYTDSAKTTSKEVQVGIFMGYGSGCTFINCHNEADVVFTNAGSPKTASSVSPFGRQQDGVKLINCSNTGDVTNNDEGRANGLTEWVNVGTPSYIYNCYSTGKLTTAYDSTYDYTGMFSTQASSGSLDPIHSVNNYIVGDSFASGARQAAALEEKGVSLAEGADASGELAYLLNANYTNYSDLGRFYYTVKNGKTERGTAANATIMVELDNAGTTFVTYVNLDAEGTIDLDTLHDVQLPIYEIVSADASCASIGAATNELTITALPEDFAININVYSDVVDLTDIKAKYNELNALPVEELSWYTSETETGTLVEWMAAVKAKIDATEAALAGAYTTGKEVAIDLGVLNSFELGEIVPIGAIVKYPDKDGYTVSTAKELEYLSTVKANLTVDQTVYFTADIDVTGWTAATYADVDGDVNNLIGLKASLDGGMAPNGKATIKGLYIEGDTDPSTSNVGNSWLGSYAGKAVKNLAFVNGTSVIVVTNYGSFLMMSTAREGMQLTNLTFDNCKSISKYSAEIEGVEFEEGEYEAANNTSFTDNRRTNLVIGQNAKNGTVLKDITIVNSTLEMHTGTGNSAFIIGAASSYTATLENIYLNNNTVVGMPSSVGSGLLIGEDGKSVSMKNVGVFNTTYEDDHRGGREVAGILVGAFKGEAAILNLENVFVANSGSAPLVLDHTTPGGTFETVKNIYTDVETVYKDGFGAITATNVNAGVADADVASGKIAYQLNAAGVAQKWAMDGTTPIFATNTAKATVAVTFKALDGKLKDVENPTATYTLYTDKDGKLIGLTQEILDAASWNEEADLATKVFDSTNNTVIGYVTPAHDHQYTYTDNGDGTHDVTCAFSHTDAELNLTFTCDYVQENVAHELEKKNISDTSTTSPYQAHQVIDVCKFCDYEADVSTATDCTGTISRDDERSWDATCAHGGMIISVCDACDYEFTRIDIPRPHNWGEWTHVDGTDTHKRSCANVAECQVADQVEDCVFENWTVTIPPEVTAEGEETGYCECGNTDTRPIPALTGIVLNPGKAVVGKTFEVAVDLENNTKVAGLELKISYNADLFTLVGAKKGAWDVVFDDSFPAASGNTTVTFNLVSNANMIGDDTVVVLEFAVKDDEALTGTKSKIEIDVTQAYDADLAPVGFAGNEVEVEILTALIKGDINGDRFVNMADAILLLRYQTEKSENASEHTINGLTITDKIADISDEGDGTDTGNGQLVPEVNINDVLYLLRYLNGWYTADEFFGA